MFGAFPKVEIKEVPKVYSLYDFRCSVCRPGVEVRWTFSNGPMDPEAWKRELKRHGDYTRHGGEATRDGKIVRIGNDGTIWKYITILSESR